MENFIFEHIHISSRVIRIRDILDTFCYLVVGDNRALLIDTGNGFGNIKEYVESLIDKPIIVALTHGHFDHVNGSGYFDEVFIHKNDINLFLKDNSLEARYDIYKNFKYVRDCPLFNYAPVFKGKINELDEGINFDLGSVTVRPIHVPGHTAGMMMFLIPEEEIILFGDACGPGTLFYDEFSTTISDYKESLSKILPLESSYKRIIRNHGTGESDKSLLHNVLDLCNKVINYCDDHESIIVNNKELFKAIKTDKHNNRLDGLQGNIIYLESKRK